MPLDVSASYCGVEVSMLASHSVDPGSIPGQGYFVSDIVFQPAICSDQDVKYEVCCVHGIRSLRCLTVHAG